MENKGMLSRNRHNYEIKEVSKGNTKLIVSMLNFHLWHNKLDTCLFFVAAVLGRALKWLGNIVNTCNEKMGQPFRRCNKAFETAFTRCKYVIRISDQLFHCNMIVQASHWNIYIGIGEQLHDRWQLHDQTYHC